ncbi:MAG: hypothetical protein HZA50_19230 [Planctomycetes bacterium]|nr:hypothetical protein [Planctomycetota bacterium]
MVPHGKKGIVGVAAGLAVIACVSSASSALAQAARPASDNEVMGAETSWRAFHVWRPEVMGTSSDAKANPRDKDATLQSPAPPAGWTTPAFDDSEWGRMKDGLQQSVYSGAFDRMPEDERHGFQQSPCLAQLCLRAGFMVDDPAQVKDLAFSAEYRGGIVVYVNGKELTRANLPKGNLTPDSLADDYPKDASLDEQGKRILKASERRNPPPAVMDRLESRVRKLTSVPVPRDMLKKGENVIALEFHRAASIKDSSDSVWWRDGWSTLGFIKARLTAGGPAGLTPIPHDGYVVWNANPLQEVAEDAVCGDPFGTAGPLKMVVARNGTCSGQVVVSSLGPPKAGAKIAATIGPLTNAESKATIPPEAVKVRFAQQPRLPGKDDKLTAAYYCDVLADEPPTDARSVPVWITVTAPADAKPGEYKGTLTIRCGAKPIEVPVSLTVCPWTLPAPRDFATHVGLLQSPESVALRYDVPLWSDKHFALLEKSMSLLGQVGNKAAYVTVIRRTHFGNEHGMIWFRSKPGGKHEADFSACDKYLDLYARCVGKPAALVLYLWEGKDERDRSAKATELPLSLMDASGKLIEWKQPLYGEAGTEEFWKDVLDGFQKRVVQRGWPQECIMLGVANDARPDPDTIEFFKKIAPYARWEIYTHGRGDPKSKNGKLNAGGLEIGYYQRPYAITVRKYPMGDGIMGGWDQAYLMCHSNRNYVLSYSALGTYRTIPDITVMAESRGFARFGLDFWPTKGTGDTGREKNIMGRYGTNIALDWNLMRSNPRAIAAPGPDGAIPTVRFEMLREGIQETEARIFIEKAITDPKISARVPPALAKKCHEMLDERLLNLLLGERSWQCYAGAGWQQRTAKLFNLAGEVAKTAGIETKISPPPPASGPAPRKP